MTTPEPREKRLFPKVYAACENDPAALEELGALLSHLDLIQEQNTRWRIQAMRSSPRRDEPSGSGS